MSDQIMTASGQMYSKKVSLLSQQGIKAKVKIADMLSNLADNPTDKQIKKYAKGLLFLVD